MIPPSRTRILGVLVPLLVAACGGAGSSSATTSSQAPSSTAPPVVKTAVATLDGKPQSIVVDAAKGMTLYYFLPDKGAGKVACTGGCLAVWPPMELADGSAPPAGTGLKGTLGTITNPNGKRQLTYNGWPLYWYAKDKAPGDTTGNNVGQKWFVATPDMAPNSGGSY